MHCSIFSIGDKLIVCGMEFDLGNLRPKERYDLLSSLVVPRPIALVTTIDENGGINAAPFSYFNLIGSDPALLVLGIGDHGTKPKDTLRNLRLIGEFVVNLVNENMGEAMNICAIDFPEDQNELIAAGLSSTSSFKVRPPRIQESPASLECREFTTLEIGRNHVVIGEILHVHLDDAFFESSVKTLDLGLIGRMHRPNGYVRTKDVFEIPRISFQDWHKKQ